MKKSIVTRWAAAAAVAVASLVAVPATPAVANPAGTGLVIREVYLNGGSSGATYTNKFIELYNPTASAIDVEGWSVQYKSNTGTSITAANTVALGDHLVGAGKSFLIQGGSNGAGGAALPAPDVISAGLQPSGSAGGVIALSKSSTSLAATTPAAMLGDPNLVDLVGYGNANTFEGAAEPAGGYNVTTSLTRSPNGADTDNNANDFAPLSPPTPLGCGTDCDGGGTVEPPAPPVAKTIPEIQGTTDTSPLVGTNVTTRGVVTAVYKTGGYNGAFIQTPGTGGTVTGGRTTSDGIFVYGSAFAAAVTRGAYVEVTGPVSEFGGTATVPSTSTQLTPAAGGWTVLTETAAPVTPAQVTFPLNAAAKEALESMLVAPQGTFTITNNYTTNQYGEIGLAPGTKPFDNPTNVVAPGAAATALQAKNDADLVTLDDGASTNYLSAANQGTPLPWLTPTNEVRVGQTLTFDDPVVLDWRNSLWKLQPLEQVDAGDNEPVVFGPSTRAPAPADVGGDLTIGTFNVLNYFSTTAEEFEAAGGTCSTYNDRTGDPVTANTCSGSGPRGAAEEEDFQRQQTKIVKAINTLDASVVSLEEIENSVAVDPTKNRDEALSTLVDALNAAAGSDRWEFVPSPAQVPASEDVIRTAFIYQPAIVTPAGASSILLGDTAFANARQPLAQAFRPVGGDAASTFVVVVNHFKSKGSGSGADADQGDGQGASNASRVAQAKALVTFADSFAEAAGTDQVFLTGDFNAYSEEDPITVLEEAGYVNVPDRYTDKETYQFGGGIGSLDHVFASPSANVRVTGADIWNINAYESIAREYSRHNYNVTDFFDATTVFRASDHDPTLVGFDPGAATTTTTASAPASIRDGQDLTVSVDVAGGASTPSGDVTVTEGEKVLGSGTLEGGSVDIVLEGLSIGTHTLTVSYGGTEDLAASSTTITTQVLRGTSGITATAAAGTYGTSAVLTVTGAPGASGLIYAVAGDELVGMGTLTNGRGTINLSRTLPVGTTAVTVFYGGDASFDPVSTTASVTVAKASTSIRKVSVSPTKIVRNRTKPFVELRVSAAGFTVDGGKVTVRASGKSYSGTVRDGKVRIRLGAFTSSGSAKKVTATYSGSSVANGSSTSFTVKVRKK